MKVCPRYALIFFWSCLIFGQSIFLSKSVAMVVCQDTQSGGPVQPFRSIAELTRRGSEYHGKKQYKESLECYGLALKLGCSDATVAFNAACSASLAGETDLGFKYLNQSIDFGWIKTDSLNSDKDLSGLHADPRWEKVVGRCAAAAKRVRTRWNSSALKTPYAENISDAQKAAGLSKIWAEVKFNFVHFEQVPDLDWDAAYMNAMPKVLATKSTLEYYTELRRLVARLNDGHTNVYFPRALSTQNSSIGIKTQLIEGKVIVTEVNDSAIRKSGVKVGMEVTKVNGLSATEHATNNVTPFVCASSPQDRESQMYGSKFLRGPLKQAVELTVRDAEGNSKTHEVKRMSTTGWLLNRVTKPAFFQFDIIETNGINVGYVRLNSFATKMASAQFAAAFEKIKKTDALILDLRKNGGGNSGVGWEILTYLTDQSFKMTRWHTLQYRPTHRAWGRQPMTRFGQEAGQFNHVKKDVYQKPVVMLIGPRTFSAAEDMAAVFDTLDRGKLIGGPTGGSTGQPLVFDLPGGGSARVCTKHDFYADGTEFVGPGIQPDVLVLPTVKDVRQGVDGVLQAALRELEKSKLENK
ncbi:MAG: S41 family peptidase [Mariniblastus sp.]